VDIFKNKYRLTSPRASNWDYRSDAKYFVTIVTRNRHCSFGKIDNSVMNLSKYGEWANKYWREIPEHSKNVRLDEFVIMPDHIHGIIILDSDLRSDGSNSDKGGPLQVMELTDMHGEVRSHADDPELQDRLNASDGGDPQMYKPFHVDSGDAFSLEPLNATALTSLPHEDQSVSQFMSQISPKEGSLGVVIRSFKSACTKKFNEIDRKAWLGWQPLYYDRIIRNTEELQRIRYYIRCNPKNW